MESDPWTTELLQQVNLISHQKTNDWISLVNILGTEETTRNEWCQKYLEDLKRLFGESCKELEEKRLKSAKEIEELKKTLQTLINVLEVEMPSTEHMNLHQEEVTLKNRITELEGKLREREEKVFHLKERQIIVCKSLGRDPGMVDLTNEDKISTFAKEIETMEREKCEREKKYHEIKSHLIHLINETNYEPSPEFETLILCEEKPFSVTDSNMNLLENFYQRVKERSEKINAEIAILKAQLQKLWSILEEDPSKFTKFTIMPNNSSTMMVLTSEIKRCEERKKEHIEVVIKRLKIELEELLSKCGFIMENRKDFDNYTEESLNTLRSEFNNVKQHYEDNKSIYETLSKYQESWEQFQELEMKMLSPNRLKNRGGQLLREEKERNLLKKRLDKYEEQLSCLSSAFSLQNGKEFIFNGKTIECLINDHHEHDSPKRVSMRKSNSINLLPGSQNIIPNKTANVVRISSGKPKIPHFLPSKASISRRLDSSPVKPMNSNDPSTRSQILTSENQEIMSTNSL